MRLILILTGLLLAAAPAFAARPGTSVGGPAAKSGAVSGKTPPKPHR